MNNFLRKITYINDVVSRPHQYLSLLILILIMSLSALMLGDNPVTGDFYTTVACAGIAAAGLDLCYLSSGYFSFGRGCLVAASSCLSIFLNTTCHINFVIAIMLSALLCGLVSCILTVPTKIFGRNWMIIITFLIAVFAAFYMPISKIFDENYTLYGMDSVSNTSITLAVFGLLAFFTVHFSWSKVSNICKEQVMDNKKFSTSMMFMYFVGATISALAGGLMASHRCMALPGDFNFESSIDLFLALITGTAGTITGPMLNAMVLAGSRELLGSYGYIRWIICIGLIIFNYLSKRREVSLKSGKNKHPIAMSKSKKKKAVLSNCKIQNKG